MADHSLPCCRGAGCAQGDKPECCDCGAAVQEFPPINGRTLVIAVVLVSLAAAASHVWPMGFAR